MTFKIEWIDSGREPQCKPDPRYPNGKDIDLVEPVIGNTCKIDLPYPAKRCGMYVVACTKCGLRIGITTAGRPDDPRSIRVYCREQLQ